MTKTNCVIAVWGGDRRGGSKDVIYCKKQIQQLEKLQHSLSQITLCISTDGNETQYFKDYITSLSHSTLPIVIHYRDNIGLSYGAYSEIYEKYRDTFDYYIFMEDDYYFSEDNFDSTLINMFEVTPNCGYVCGYVSRAGGKEWMGNSNGITSSAVLEKVRNKYGCIPYDSTCVGATYTEESGQVSFSDAFIRSGFKLKDITHKYEILHYYWQHTKVMPIPNQKNYGCPKHLFLPFEAGLNKTTFPLNAVFEPYKDVHKDKEAIVFATGPTLNAYDYLEDDGNRIKVGVNSIALKPVTLDYYFCGHVDARSVSYLNVLKDFKVNKAKFGFISHDGISSPQWLGLQRAKDLGLKPYGITTHVDFSSDITKKCLVNHLIIFSAIQFLLHTGVSKIYLVGSDATQLVSYSNFNLDTDRNIERVKSIFRDLADHVAGKVEIVSINPVGLRGIFSDITRCDMAPFLKNPTLRSKPVNYINAQNQTILDASNGYGNPTY